MIDQRPDGRVLLVWRDDVGAADASVLARISTDEGANWSAPAKIARDVLPEGKPAHTPNGTWVMPHYLNDSILVARSLDGLSWNDVVAFHAAASITPTRNGGPYAGNPAIAADAKGTLYLAWSEGALGQQTGLKEADMPQVFLITSSDGGATWSTPRAISPAAHASIMPTMVAGAAGRVAIAWYENQDGIPNEAVPDAWNVRVAESIDGGVAFQSVLVQPTPTHVGGICTDGGACLPTARDRFAGDFFSIALTPQGNPVVAFAADGPEGSRASASVKVAVLDGTKLT
jgi:hypothetical protein